ncbi:hypothetical protein [Clostridium sp.]|uniref:hypothetical protein n=1 Tax=Clostridium sp. TaxID=1506 RepID=UPI003217534A
MSAFALKREYALQLPNSYVDIDRDEMEYVDGGSTSVSRYYDLTGLFHAILGLGTGAGAVYASVRTLWTVTELAAKKALKACVSGLWGYATLVYNAAQIALACTYLNRYRTFSVVTKGIGSVNLFDYVAR